MTNTTCDKYIVLHDPTITDNDASAQYWIEKIREKLNDGFSYLARVTFKYNVSLPRTFWDKIFRRYPVKVSEFTTSSIFDFSLIKKGDEVNCIPTNTAVIWIHITQKDSNRFVATLPVFHGDDHLSFACTITKERALRDHIGMLYTNLISITFIRTEQ
jgi:hypothetical protein